MIRLKNILFEATRGVVSKTNNVKIPLIFGLTYDLKVLQNGRDITEYIHRPPDTKGRSDILIRFQNNIPITLDLDIFEVKFTPIDGDNLDPKDQKILTKLYAQQEFKMTRGESFPILSPATIPSFRIAEKEHDDYMTVYKGNASGYYGDEYPYDTNYKDFEIYNGDQFNVYVTEINSGNSSVSITSSQKGRNKKTIQKLSKEGWKLSAVKLDDIINNEELQYVEKAGMNNRGFAGVFVGKSKDDIRYFIYVPGLQGYRGWQDVTQKSSFFTQFADDAQGVYEGGNYFKFNDKDPTNYN